VRAYIHSLIGSFQRIPPPDTATCAHMRMFHETTAHAAGAPTIFPYSIYGAQPKHRLGWAAWPRAGPFAISTFRPPFLGGTERTQRMRSPTARLAAGGDSPSHRHRRTAVPWREHLPDLTACPWRPDWTWAGRHRPPSPITCAYGRSRNRRCRTPASSSSCTHAPTHCFVSANEQPRMWRTPGSYRHPFTWQPAGQPLICIVTWLTCRLPGERAAYGCVRCQKTPACVHLSCHNGAPPA
jgi:hypothetical protein